MKRSRTPWSPLAPSAALLCLLVGSLAGCVLKGTYDEVVAQRDRLTVQRDDLKARVQLLETSNESLSEERVQLLGEIEDLRGTKDGLERDVRALENKHEDASTRLAERERELEAQRKAREDAEREVQSLRSTYDGLVADLTAEVEAGRVAVERLRSGVQVALPSEVVFAAGSAEPTPEGRALVARLAAGVRASTDRVEVHGHTDGVPIRGPLAARFPTNWELAAARASRVARLLVENGVDGKRVVAVSHGSNDPVAPDDTPENRARNRRIEVRLVPAELTAPETGAAPSAEAAPEPPAQDPPPPPAPAP